MASLDAIAEAYVRLRAKDDGSLGRDVQSIVGRVATDAASLFAGKKLLDVGIAGLDELKQAQTVTTQTAVQLKATGEAAGVSAQHIDELGQKMLDLAGFDDEAARSAANVLLQFNQIKGVAAFDRVESDAADLAVTLKEQLPDAARTLGLALQDPEKGIRLLRAANVVLTDSQKAQLKVAEQSNDAAKEQDIVLTAVEARVQGAAAAYGTTLAGGLQRAHEELKNAKEALVSGFTPAIQFGATAATAFAHVVEEMPAGLQATVGGVVFLGGGIASLIRPVGDVLRLLDGIRTARAAHAAATTVDTTTEVENTAAIVANAAAAETQTEALASVDAATLRRITSNEALSFSDTEVLAAQQARATAAFQALVGNDALIAADEELIAADLALATAEQEAAAAAAELAAFEAAYAGTVTEAAAATEAATAATAGSELASAGLLSTLGPLGLALGVAAAGFTLFALNSGDGEKSAKALDSALQQLDTDLASLSSGSTQSVTGDLKAFLDQLVAATTDGGDKYRDTLNTIGLTTGQFADVLGKGTAASARFVAELAFGSDATEDQLRTLGDLVEKTDQHAKVTLLADVAQGRLTQAQLDNAAASHLNASGTADWVATLHALQPAIAAAAASTSALTATQADQMTGARNLFDAQQAMTTAEHGVVQAARGVQEAERGVADANRRLEDSYRSVADAQQRVVDAQTALDKALAGPSAEDQGKAVLDLGDANLRVADATRAVGDAQKQLDKDRRLHDSPEKIAKDQDALTKAQNDLQRATYGVTDSQDALNKVNAKGSDQDPAVIQARKDLTDANKGLADANRGVADAVTAVADAQQRVSDAKAAVNDAYLTEADASSKLKDAQDGLNGATVTANQSLENELTALQNIDKMLAPGSPGRAHLDEYIGNLFVLAGLFDPSLLAGLPDGLIQPGNGQVVHRAAGGHLDAGQMAIVNEQGQEMFVPDVAGTVLPNSAYRAWAGGTPKGGDIIFNGPVLDQDAIGRMVRHEFERHSALGSVMNSG